MPIVFRTIGARAIAASRSVALTPRCGLAVATFEGPAGSLLPGSRRWRVSYVMRPVRCPRCGGDKRDPDDRRRKCSECDGDGEVLERDQRTTPTGRGGERADRDDLMVPPLGGRRLVRLVYQHGVFHLQERSRDPRWARQRVNVRDAPRRPASLTTWAPRGSNRQPMHAPNICGDQARSSRPRRDRTSPWQVAHVSGDRSRPDDNPPRPHRPRLHGHRRRIQVGERPWRRDTGGRPRGEQRSRLIPHGWDAGEREDFKGKNGAIRSSPSDRDFHDELIPFACIVGSRLRCRILIHHRWFKTDHSRCPAACGALG